MSEVSTLFGWTLEQIAHAKARHARMTGERLMPDSSGILVLRNWWDHQGWPEPLSTQFAEVDTEQDIGWAADAVCYVVREHLR